MTSGSTRSGSYKQSPTRAAEMSTKQLLRAALDSKVLGFTMPYTTPVPVWENDGIHHHDAPAVIRGKLVGLDDYHYLVVDERAQIHLIHKSAPCITIGIEWVPTDEAVQLAEDIGTPFLESLGERPSSSLGGVTS